MMRKWPLKRYVLVFGAVLLLALAYDYFHGLTIINASVTDIVIDPVTVGRREIRVTIVSDYPEYPFVPASVRNFFRLQPILCFANPDGSELVNDDIQSPCLPEENAAAKKAKGHHMERSEFAIPIYLHATPYNGKRQFFRSIGTHKGLWLRFGLRSYVFPPDVVAAPVFVNLDTYCQRQREKCMGLLPLAD